MRIFELKIFGEAEREADGIDAGRGAGLLSAVKIGDKRNALDKGPFGERFE